MKHLLPLLLACLFLLSACVRSETTITVLPGDLISMDIQIRLNRTLAEQGGITPATLAQDAEKRIPADAGAVVTVNEIDEPDWIGTHVSTLPIPADQFDSILRYRREQGQVRLEIPTTSLMPSHVDMDNLKQFGAAATLAIHMPGPIVETNGTIQDQQVEWDLTNAPESLVVVAQSGPEWWVYALTGAGIVIGVVVLIVGLWRRQRGNQRRTPPPPAQT